jgi:hypothetical protein
MACAAPAIGARVHADAETGFHLGTRTLRFGAVESTVHRCLPPLAARRLLPARQSPASRDEGGSAATGPRILAPDKATSPQKTRVGGSRGCPWGRSSRRRFRTREIATVCHRYGYKTVLGRRRWLNRDPLGEPGFELSRGGKVNALGDGANPYTFIRNSPPGAFDPDGTKTRNFWSIFLSLLASCGKKIPPTAEWPDFSSDCMDEFSGHLHRLFNCNSLSGDGSYECTDMCECASQSTKGAFEACYSQCVRAYERRCI